MRGSSLVTLALVLLVTYHVVGQDTSALGNTPDVLYYDLPYDNLSFISEDYPIAVTFERTSMKVPLLKFSLANSATGARLENMIQQDNGKFIFSAANAGVNESSIEAVSAATQSSVSVTLLVGLLGLVFSQQHRKLGVFLAISLVVLFCSANTAQTNVYQVIVQIPANADFPFDSITVQSNEGGSLISAVEFSPRKLYVDFCGGASSEVTLSKFHVTGLVNICATLVDVQGVFEDQLQGSIEGTVVNLRMTNEFSGRLQLNSDFMTMNGAEYCEISGNLMVCGEESGRIQVTAESGYLLVTPDSDSSPAPVAPIPVPGPVNPRDRKSVV